MDHISEKKILPQNNSIIQLRDKRTAVESIKLSLLLRVGLVKRSNMTRAYPYKPVLNGVLLDSCISFVNFNFNISYLTLSSLCEVKYSHLFTIIRGSFWGIRPFRLLDGNLDKSYTLAKKKKSRKYFFRKRFNIKHLKKVKSRRLVSRLNKLIQDSTTRNPYKIQPARYKFIIRANRLEKYSWRKRIKVKRANYLKGGKYIKLLGNKRVRSNKFEFSLTRGNSINIIKSRTKSYPLERKMLRNNLSFLNVLGFFPISEPVNLANNSGMCHPWYRKSKNYKASLFLSRYVVDFSRSILRNQLTNKLLLEDNSVINLARKPNMSLISKRVAMRYLYGRKNRLLLKVRDLLSSQKQPSNLKKARALPLRPLKPAVKLSGDKLTRGAGYTSSLRSGIKKHKRTVGKYSPYLSRGSDVTKTRLFKSRVVSNLMRSPLGRSPNKFKWSSIFTNSAAVLFEVANRPAYQSYWNMVGDKNKIDKLCRIKSVTLLKLILSSNKPLISTILSKKNTYRRLAAKKYLNRLLYKRIIALQGTTFRFRARNSKLQHRLNTRLKATTSFIKGSSVGTNSATASKSNITEGVINGLPNDVSLQYRGATTNVLYDVDLYDAGYLFKPSPYSPVHGSSDHELFELESKVKGLIVQLPIADALERPQDTIYTKGRINNVSLGSSKGNTLLNLSSKLKSKLKKKVKPKLVKPYDSESPRAVLKLTHRRLFRDKLESLSLPKVKSKIKLGIKNYMWYSNALSNGTLGLKRAVKQRHTVLKASSSKAVSNLKQLRLRVKNAIKLTVGNVAGLKKLPHGIETAFKKRLSVMRSYSKKKTTSMGIATIESNYNNHLKLTLGKDVVDIKRKKLKLLQPKDDKLDKVKLKSTEGSTKTRNESALSKKDSDAPTKKISFFERNLPGYKTNSNSRYATGNNSNLKPKLPMKSVLTKNKNKKKKILSNKHRSAKPKLLNTKMFNWLSTKSSSVMKSILKRKVNYKLKLISGRNRFNTVNRYFNLTDKLSIMKQSKKFVNGNKLIKERRFTKLSNSKGQLKTTLVKFAARRKKLPVLDKGHFNLITNLHDHLLNKFSLMSLYKVNYVKSKTLSQVKYPFFKNMKLSKLPKKLTTFLGFKGREGRLDLKNRLFLSDLLPSKENRSIIYSDVSKYTKYKQSRFFSKTSLTFFREPNLSNYTVKPAKRLQDRYRKNWKKRKLLLILKLKLLKSKLSLGKKRQIDFRRTSKYKNRNFRRRRLSKRFFQNKRLLAKIKLPNRRSKKPWQISKRFRKKWWKLRKKRRSIFFMKRKVKKIRRKFVKRKNIADRFALRGSIKKKSYKLFKPTRLKSLMINDRYMVNAISSNKNYNSYSNSVSILRHRISVLNKDKFIVKGLKKGQLLMKKIKKYNERVNYVQSTNVIKLVNLHRMWITKYWFLKYARKKLLRSKTNPELYLTSIRRGLSKYKVTTKRAIRLRKKTKLSKIRFSNNSKALFKLWRRKHRKLNLSNKLARLRWRKKSWARRKWTNIRLSQSKLIKQKLTKSGLPKSSWSNNKLSNDKRLKGKRLRYQWYKDKSSKTWSKKLLSPKFSNKKTKVKLINSRNKYIRDGYKKIGKWKKAFRSLSTKKLKTSVFKKRSLLDSFKTLYRPVISLQNKWNLISKVSTNKDFGNLSNLDLGNLKLPDYLLLLYKMLGLYLPNNNQSLFSLDSTLNYHNISNRLTLVSPYSVLQGPSTRCDYLSISKQCELYKGIKCKFKVKILKRLKIAYTYTDSVEGGAIRAKQGKKRLLKKIIMPKPKPKLKINQPKLYTALPSNISNLMAYKFKLLKSKFNFIKLKLRNTKVKSNLNKTTVVSSNLTYSKVVRQSYLLTNNSYLLKNYIAQGVNSPLSNDSFSTFVTKFLCVVNSHEAVRSHIKKYKSVYTLGYQPLLIPNTVNLGYKHSHYLLTNESLDSNSISCLANLKPSSSKQRILPKPMVNYLSSAVWNLVSHDIGFSKLLVINYDLFTTINKSDSLISKLSRPLIYKLSYEFGSISPTFFIDEVINVILLSLRYKDANILMGWVTYFFNKITIKKHKKALAFLKKLFKSLGRTGKLYELGCKGFMFDIRGKVGVSGSKKKRHVSVLHGERSASNKGLRWSYKKGLVYTKTGVLGVTIVIYY